MSRIPRTTLYCGVSTLVTIAVIVNAFEARPNFFSAAIYLSQSSACLMVLTNMFLVFTLMGGKLLQTIFFGRLRAIEVDHLYEKAWYAVTETCLAMTIFREEFDTMFFLFFTLLLLVKIFHWLTQDRIDYMEQTVEVARSFHWRMTSIIAVLLSVDIYLVRICMEKVFAKGPNVMIMFAFEFTILAATVLGVAGKYVLNLIEARHTETWDNKSIYVFYLELAIDFIKLVTYVAFFATIMTFYGIPLHIIRDLYVTLRSFTTKCRNFMRFRKATKDMDARYPNATIDELNATGDMTCIVCREEMLHETQPVPAGEPAHTPLDNPKRLPCGHILHFRCLRSWLERQQSCPMCRRPVLEDNTSTTNRGNATATNQPGAAPHGHPQAPAGDGRAADRNTTPQNMNGPQYQVPGTQGIDPIQLPRGFQLPPGWALLPVTAPDNMPSIPQSGEASAESASTESLQQPPTRISPASSATAASNAQPSRNVSVPRLPPMIPLFDSNSHRHSRPITLPLDLTDEQIAAMETSTRRTVEERLRLLNDISNRVSEGLTMLTRLQSIGIPSSAPATAPAAESRVPGPSEPAASPTDKENHVTREHNASQTEQDPGNDDTAGSSGTSAPTTDNSPVDGDFHHS